MASEVDSKQGCVGGGTVSHPLPMSTGQRDESDKVKMVNVHVLFVFVVAFCCFLSSNIHILLESDNLAEGQCSYFYLEIETQIVLILFLFCSYFIFVLFLFGTIFEARCSYKKVFLF